MWRQFEGINFYYSATHKLWDEAEAACEQLGTGWHLATIRNDAENAFANSLISEDTYFGLNDAAMEGTYVWASGLTSTYTNWYIGEYTEPNGVPNENYGAIRPDGKWSDVEQSPRVYLCSVSVLSSSKTFCQIFMRFSQQRSALPRD